MEKKEGETGSFYQKEEEEFAESKHKVQFYEDYPFNRKELESIEKRESVDTQHLTNREILMLRKQSFLSPNPNAKTYSVKKRKQSTYLLKQSSSSSKTHENSLGLIPLGKENYLFLFLFLFLFSFLSFPLPFPTLICLGSLSSLPPICLLFYLLLKTFSKKKK